MCGNLNQGNSEDEEDDLNEDRRVLCVNRRIGQCEMWFSDKGPMTPVARQNPLHDQMYDDLQTMGEYRKGHCLDLNVSLFI